MPRSDIPTSLPRRSGKYSTSQKGKITTVHRKMNRKESLRLSEGVLLLTGTRSLFNPPAIAAVGVLKTDSLFSLFQTVYQAGDHLGYDLQLIPTTADDGFFNQSFAADDFQQRYAFLNTAAGNNKEVPAIVFCESAVSFGKVCRNGQRRPIQLVRQEVVSPWEFPGQSCDLVNEVNGFLINIKIFKHERHFVSLFLIGCAVVWQWSIIEQRTPFRRPF